MIDPHAPAVVLGEAAVPLAALLRRLHQRGRLLPLLREAAVEELIERQMSAALFGQTCSGKLLLVCPSVPQTGASSPSSQKPSGT